MPNIHLVLGGARSGKSSYAEKQATTLAKSLKKSLVYIATAQANDEEMAERIKKHQQDRVDNWLTIETPLRLVEELKALKSQKVVVLIDCLTLWLTNHLCQASLDSWRQAKSELLSLLTTWSDGNADLIFVSNEVGHGIVPMGELSRQFVDESGWLHQEIAALANKVDFIMAGLPLVMKATEEQK